MNEMEKLEAIRSRLEKAKKEHAILTGKLESANEELNKMGYSSVEKANDGLDSLEKDAEKLEKEYEVLISKFKVDYPELVDYA